MPPPPLHSSIVSHGDIVTEPTEIYGSGPLLLRVGNGGAGATGLIRALAEDYLTTLPAPRSMAWICNHSRNTQLALLHGHIDIGLTYERDQEARAAQEGWSVTAGCIMHDHFCLAGPVRDPAGIRNLVAPESTASSSSSSSSSLSSSLSLVQHALLRIAQHKALFHSRADQSATMWKERSLWPPDLRPWEHLDDEAVASWYRTSLLSPAEALRRAHAEGAYLLTDRSTLLRQVALGNMSNNNDDNGGDGDGDKKQVTVFFEPEGGGGGGEGPDEDNDNVLMNSCYAVHSPNPSREVKAFVEYLKGARAQSLIGSYGEDQAGLPLFATVAEGIARTKLRGGRAAVGGKWVSGGDSFVD